MVGADTLGTASEAEGIFSPNSLWLQREDDPQIYLHLALVRIAKGFILGILPRIAICIWSVDKSDFSI